MQYKDGKKAQKNDNKSFNNTESFRSTSGKRAIIPTANAVDIIPYFVKAANSIQLGAPQLAFA